MLILLGDGDALAAAAVAGRLGDELLGIRVPAEGAVGDALARGRVARVASVRDGLDASLGRHLGATTALLVPLVYRGRPLGVLCAFDRGATGAEFRRDDERLLESFAASAATAVATAQNVANEGMRRSIEASERERRRWARELHDETLQELAGLRVLLSGARRSGDPAVIRRALDAALEQIDTEITGLRRLITDLRPAALDEFGIASAVAALAERISATSGLQVDVDVELDDERPPAEVENALYRMAQEALTNVVKHAGATAVRVAIAARDGHLELVVADDGRGFDAQAPSDGFGLQGMRERAALYGGTFEAGPRAGGGFTVRATLPAEEP